MLSLLTSCGQAAPVVSTPTPAPTQRPATAAAQPPPVTIVWSYWGDQSEVEINQRIIRAFQAIHPEIRVETQHEPWATYFRRLEADWSQKRAPDVMFLNNIPIYARTGALENLEPYIERDRLNVADFYPTLMETFRYNGHLHGLPRDNDTKVIFYNKRLLNTAGLEAPTSDWTWEQLRQAALKLTRRDATGAPNQYGFSYVVNAWWRIWVWQNIGDILDDHFQPTRVRLDEPAAIEAIQYLANLTTVDRVTPAYEQLNGDAQRALFLEGKVAMIVDNHSFVPAAAQTPGLQWDVAPLPRGQRRANLAGGAGYVISSWSAQKEAAWTFLKFLTGPEGQALFAESGVIVPARRSIREENIFFRQQRYNAQVFVNETEIGVHNYYFPQANAMDTYLDQELAPVFKGKESAATAVARVVPHLRQIIARPGA
jgi:multiple sugar transport system substrate-binding protein